MRKDFPTNVLQKWEKFFVKKDERALLFRKGDFVQVLGPGDHWLFDPANLSETTQSFISYSVAGNGGLGQTRIRTI